MLTFSGLSKTLGGRTLFEEASLSITEGERIGLVGPNGAGKTTLIKILLGHESPDDGDIAVIRGTRVGFLPQETAPAGDETVLEVATGVLPGSGHDEHHMVDGQMLAKAKRILAGLSFRESDYDRPSKELSGGWVMRAHLARLLADEPDLLMLDEPTNHLDLETLIWFQDYLLYYPGALMVISHDREFLNRLCTHTVEIRRSKLNRYTGNYDSYLVQCAANEQTALATQKSQQRRIDQLQEFVDRFGAKNTKATQAQSKLKQIERIREEMTDIPENNGPTMAMTFPQPQRSGQKVITLDDIHFAYGTNRIYDGIEIRIERGERVVLVGPNGAGKSTLLKLLAGAITAQSGTRELGHNVRVGYYAQYRLDMLDASRTVLDEALDTPQRVTEQAVRTILGSFLFRGDDVFKKVKVLSGGEKSRLALVKLLLDPPNFLLMDEPTTHLDMPSIDALVGALKQYQGTLVFISHDVHFIRALANQVIHVRGGKLTRYPGDYQYYLDKTAQTERAGLTAGDKVIQPSSGRRDSAPVLPPADRKEAKRLETENREARAKQKRELQSRVKQLEAEIHKLEARQKAIVAELEKPDSYSKGGNATALNRELAELQDRLPVATAEWEKTAAELAPFDGETA